MTDRAAWTAATAQVRRIEALVHLAAETGTGQSMYEAGRYHRVNVDGTRRAAEFAVAHGIPLVVLSSWAVYGEGRYQCLYHRPTFGRPCCPAALTVVRLQSVGLTHVRVRRAGDVEHACADLTRMIEVGAPVPVLSAADAVRDFVRSSWDRPGAPASRWDKAMSELEERGLTSWAGRPGPSDGSDRDDRPAPPHPNGPA